MIYKGSVQHLQSANCWFKKKKNNNNNTFKTWLEQKRTHHIFLAFHFYQSKFPQINVCTSISRADQACMQAESRKLFFHLLRETNISTHGPC
jgi:hypothetical protein